jgi:hypothetical protein
MIITGILCCIPSSFIRNFSYPNGEFTKQLNFIRIPSDRFLRYLAVLLSVFREIKCHVMTTCTLSDDEPIAADISRHLRVQPSAFYHGDTLLPPLVVAPYQLALTTVSLSHSYS